MHVVVATCAHRGDDARIAHRQIPALLDAGHEVTLVAPAPVPFARDRFRHVEIPRAVGRGRLRSWRAMRRAVRATRPDVLLVHDVELVLATPRRPDVPRIWDVHEDYAAAVADRAWVPSALRPLVRRLVTALERSAHRRFTLVLAEHAYRDRHPGAAVVPNTTVVPAVCAPAEPGGRRVVYLGRISRSRGLAEMIELGRRLRGDATVELIGAVDQSDQADLDAAVGRGDVVWSGFVPNDEALRLVEGALVGVSLLHDQPNFRHSMPTKLVEYLARGVPVISTRLPVAAELVAAAGGTVVDFGDVDAVERAVRALLADPGARERLGRDGHAFALEHRNWTRDARDFVALVERAAAR